LEGKNSIHQILRNVALVMSSETLCCALNNPRIEFFRRISKNKNKKTTEVDDSVNVIAVHTLYRLVCSQLHERPRNECALRT
jgi:hypothetical protein